MDDLLCTIGAILENPVKQTFERGYVDFFYKVMCKICRVHDDLFVPAKIFYTNQTKYFAPFKSAVVAGEKAASWPYSTWKKQLTESCL